MMADFVVPPSPQPFLSTPTGKFPVGIKIQQEFPTKKLVLDPKLNIIGDAIVTKSMQNPQGCSALL